jgi:hypothetical protein
VPRSADITVALVEEIQVLCFSDPIYTLVGLYLFIIFLNPIFPSKNSDGQNLHKSHWIASVELILLPWYANEDMGSFGRGADSELGVLSTTFHPVRLLRER